MPWGRPGRQSFCAKATEPPARASESRIRRYLKAMMDSTKDPLLVVEKWFENDLGSPGAGGDDVTLGLVEFLKESFSTERDLVKEAFKAAKQVEALWPDLFEDALVVTLNDLEDELVRDFSDQEDWKHFVLVLVTALKVWGTRADQLMEFVKNILGKWINQMKKPKLTAVDPTGSFDQLLYSACSHLLLKEAGSVILEMYPLNFDILFDMIYERVLADDLPRRAKTNYLDTLLEMQLQKNLSKKNIGRGSERMQRGEPGFTLLPEGSLGDFRKVPLDCNANEVPVSKEGTRPHEERKAPKVKPIVNREVNHKSECAEVSEPMNLEEETGATSGKHRQIKPQVAELEPKEEESDGTLEASSPRTVVPSRSTPVPSKNSQSTVVAHIKSLNRQEPPYIVTTHAPLVLGRSRANCQVVIRDPKVSRIHAEIRAQDDSASIVLMSPLNCVVINSERIFGITDTERLTVPLLHGDTIQIGKDLFRLEYVIGSENVYDSVRPLCRQANFTTGLHSSPSAKSVPAPTKLQEREDQSSSCSQRHPDHPGSPVNIGIATDLTHTIKPKPMKVQESESRAQDIEQLTHSGQETGDLHEFGNFFSLAPRLGRQRELASMRRESVSLTSGSRNPIHSGDKFRGGSAKGDRFKPAPKTRDIYREQEEFLRSDDQSNWSTTAVKATPSTTEDDAPFGLTTNQRQLIEEPAAVQVPSRSGIIGLGRLQRKTHEHQPVTPRKAAIHGPDSFPVNAAASQRTKSPEKSPKKVTSSANQRAKTVEPTSGQAASVASQRARTKTMELLQGRGGASSQRARTSDMLFPSAPPSSPRAKVKDSSRGKMGMGVRVKTATSLAARGSQRKCVAKKAPTPVFSSSSDDEDEDVVVEEVQYV